MAYRCGVIPGGTNVALGQPGFQVTGLGNVSGGVSPSLWIYTTVIQNTFGNSWLWLENRMSAPLNIQPNPQIATPGQALTPRAPVQGGISIPGLSRCCVPIEPDLDVLVSLARSPRGAEFGRSFGNAAAPTGTMQEPLSRNIPYMLFDNGQFLIDELYPLKDCAILVVQHTMGAGVQTFDCVVPPTSGSQPANTLLQTGGLNDRRWPPAPPDDACIMAVQCAIFSVGASSALMDLVCSYQADSINGTTGSTLDVSLFNNLTTIPQDTSDLLILPGVGSVAWTNTGTTAIQMRAMYYVGIPCDIPQVAP